MNKEDLFEGFGALDDDLIKRSEPGGEIMKKGKTISGFLKYGSIAACFVVALGAGMLFADNKTPNPDAVPKSSVVGERNDLASAEQGNMQEKQNEADDPATGQNKESEGKETQDSPVDEETYQEAREYSVELTDLQNRISQAMMNHELPFVTSSAIYENPDRIHVCVNTTNEDLIAKLQAFDPTGKLLEIEYSERSILE